MAEDYLERNIERLLMAVEPELKLGDEKKDHITAVLAQEGESISAGGSVQTFLLSRWTKLAVAAVLIIASLIGIILLGDYFTPPKEQIATGSEKSAEQIVPREERTEDEYSPSDLQRARMEEELRQIFGMIANEDVDGLLKMLERGELTSQIAAAGFLAKIGEPRAIGPLGRLSEQWYGRDEGNVFAMALQQITEQLAKPQDATEEVPKPGETKPKPRLAEFVPKGVLSGRITDIETGEPVVGAKLKISKGRYFHAVTDPNGFYYMDDISEDGNYRVEVSSLEYLWVSKWSEIPVVALAKGGRAVKHFKLRRGCQVEVDVVDEQGGPIKGADVSITWMGQKYGRETEVGRRFERTDGTGRTRKLRTLLPLGIKILPAVKALSSLPRRMSLTMRKSLCKKALMLKVMPSIPTEHLRRD